MSALKSFYRGIVHTGDFFAPFLLLAMRLYWGYEFFLSGMGKLQNPTPVAEYFSTLGIPFPTLSVYLAGGAEWIGGALLIVGFASRLAAIPLMITMVVAYVTAHHEAIADILTDPHAFVSELPFTFLLTAALIFCFGPGLFSIDAILKKLFNRTPKNINQTN